MKIGSSTRQPGALHQFCFWQQVGWLHVNVLTSFDRRYFAYRVKKARKPAAQSKHYNCSSETSPTLVRGRFRHRPLGAVTILPLTRGETNPRSRVCEGVKELVVLTSNYPSDVPFYYTDSFSASRREPP